MSCEVSAKMKRAVKMVQAGSSRYAAAKACKVTVTGITRSKPYQAALAAGLIPAPQSKK